MAARAIAVSQPSPASPLPPPPAAATVPTLLNIPTKHVSLRVIPDIINNALALELTINPTREIFTGTFCLSTDLKLGDSSVVPKVEPMAAYITGAIHGRVNGQHNDYVHGAVTVTATADTIQLFIPGPTKDFAGHRMTLRLVPRPHNDLRASLIAMTDRFDQLESTVSLLVKELKDLKCTPARIPLPLLNGWTHHGTPGVWAAPVYYRTHDGMVHVSGLVQGPSSQSVIANLPVGYRPVEHLLFATDGHNQHARINIIPDGNIQLEHGHGTHISLDCITFFAAPAP